MAYNKYKKLSDSQLRTHADVVDTLMTKANTKWRVLTDLETEAFHEYCATVNTQEAVHRELQRRRLEGTDPA